MNTANSGRWAVWLSFPLAVLLAVACLGGLVDASVYARESRLLAAQGIGGDAGNLLITTPLLVLTAWLALRGSLAARLVWMGVLVDLIYNYLYCALALPFNALFPLYCGVLALSFYALAGGLPSLAADDVASRAAPRAPVKTVAVVLLLMSLGTAAHWMQEIVPAAIGRRVPQSVIDSGLLSAPVAALDLAFMMPASVIAAVLLWRRKSAGFVLGPVLLTFLALGSLVLAVMGVAMARSGIEAGRALVAIGAGIAAVAGWLLWRMLPRS
ncbi:MAG TPA: hypothetical protein VMJ34_23690 [Bryobacteraceae bacterium]|nr:hypothetical protein [Bryobacteraceae bacterium]